MDDREKIARLFEKRHLQNIKGDQKRLQKIYNKAIDKIFAKVSILKMKGNVFNIEFNPTIKRLVDNVLLEVQEQVTALIINGIDTEWELSESKIDEIVLNHLSKDSISEITKEALLSRRSSALEAFKKRKIKGLSLSDRVWKYTNQFRSEIEQGLFVGISEGKSAVEMARDQKQYLQDPDKLFRRVRDAKGNLKLSKAAKKYKPGQGVYRSSYKNALRLTRTETNMAYRNADSDRYNRTQFVLGFEVKLSANHPAYDVCDHLKGKYPSSFKFTGWHPNCLCFSVPIFPPREEFNKYQSFVLKGKGDQFKFENPIKKVPAGLTKYVKDNQAMLNRIKSKPYWIKDNNIKI